MRFISDDKVRFLGKRKSNNENGQYYSINCCDESGLPSRFYCTEDAYDEIVSLGVDFGDEVILHVDMSFYNNRFSARIISVNRV